MTKNIWKKIFDGGILSATELTLEEKKNDYTLCLRGMVYLNQPVITDSSTKASANEKLREYHTLGTLYLWKRRAIPTIYRKGRRTAEGMVLYLRSLPNITTTSFINLLRIWRRARFCTPARQNWVCPLRWQSVPVSRQTTGSLGTEGRKSHYWRIYAKIEPYLWVY